MELDVLRQFVQDHPGGVVIRMIDGRTYRVPHRDYIWFGAPKEMLSGKRVVKGTSFILHESPGLETMRLVNAMLVAEVTPIEANGNGTSKGDRDTGSDRKD